ncbi:hypothetical protein BDZ91DRAFT_71034 [Kalaharituber pfeilii]|nr:hypothetical protein BDZ91DRAFT_71034 [Kalaharituber pfeilii]
MPKVPSELEGLSSLPTSPYVYNHDQEGITLMQIHHELPTAEHLDGPNTQVYHYPKPCVTVNWRPATSRSETDTYSRPDWDGISPTVSRPLTTANAIYHELPSTPSAHELPSTLPIQELPAVDYPVRHELEATTALHEVDGSTLAPSRPYTSHVAEPSFDAMVGKISGHEFGNIQNRCPHAHGRASTAPARTQSAFVAHHLGDHGPGAANPPKKVKGMVRKVRRRLSECLGLVAVANVVKSVVRGIKKLVGRGD